MKRNFDNDVVVKQLIRNWQFDIGASETYYYCKFSREIEIEQSNSWQTRSESISEKLHFHNLVQGVTSSCRKQVSESWRAFKFDNTSDQSHFKHLQNMKVNLILCRRSFTRRIGCSIQSGKKSQPELGRNSLMVLSTSLELFETSDFITVMRQRRFIANL